MEKRTLVHPYNEIIFSTKEEWGGGAELFINELSSDRN